LLKETVGVTFFDKCISIFFKLLYLLLRFILTIALGKRRRDKLYLQREIGFNSFFYKCMKLLGLANHILLQINVPKYNYKFFCRSNNEDFTFMTGHEDKILKHFRPEDGDTVIDVGAHVGHYTIIASKHVGPNGKVIAIEADPGNFEMLNKNIKLNGLTNVIPLKYAASSIESRIKLYTPAKESGYTIYNTIILSRSKPGEKFIEVDGNTLDNLLQQNGIREEEISWIKIDVEGAELEVLKGAGNVLSKSKNLALIIEVHSLDLYKALVEFLNLYNFKIEFERGDGDWRHIVTRKTA
jgi:FkbM family methyltransferase